MDPLVILTDDQIQNLLELLESDIPRSVHAHNYINCVLKWKKVGARIDCRVMAPQGDYTDCTFILRAVLGGFNSYTAYSSSADGHRRLADALEKSSRVDWDSPFLVSCVPESIATVIENDIKKKVDLEIDSNPGLVYWMSREEASRIPLSVLPEDVSVEMLKAEDSRRIDEVWPHRDPGSERLIALMIELQGGLGLYSKSGGHLLSWGLYWFYGGMGVVQTDERHFRKGYGSAIVQRLTRYIASEAGTDVHLNIVADNVPSVKMYEKLGFRYSWSSRWISPKVNAMDPLVTLTEDRIPHLIEMLKAQLPQSIHSYYFLDCLLDWKKRKASVVGRVMAPQGDFSDATFVAYFQFGKMFAINIHSATDSGYDRLEEALINTRRIPWDGLFLFTCLTPRSTESMKRVLKKTVPPPTDNGGQERDDGCFYSYDRVLWMTAEQASRVDQPRVPDDLYLDKLSECDVKQIDEVYPHRFEGSEEMMSLSVELNPTLGLFRKSDSRLLSWGMLSFYGGLGVVQTVEEHKRKGYAKIVIGHLTRTLGRMGKDVHLNILAHNEASLKCFGSVGFRDLYTSTWVFPLVFKN